MRFLHTNSISRLLQAFYYALENVTYINFKASDYKARRRLFTLGSPDNIAVGLKWVAVKNIGEEEKMMQKMTGCNDTCGNVRIPFPFGIGAKCSLNEWYNVDCDSSTPYLSSLDHLEVLDVDLGYHTVTVKMHKFSNCSQTSESVDLGSSPFLYSKSYNTFVYEGYCGNAVMMDNHGGVLTGCSTICINDTKYNTTGIIDTSNCFGISCCQTKISQYLESYSMNLTSIERQKGGDDVCGSAYLLDKRNHLSHQSARDGTSYIPTSLQWFLSDHDREKVSCSSDWEKRVMDLGNGTMMDSWSCYGGSGIKGNPYLIDGYGWRVGYKGDEWDGEMLKVFVVPHLHNDPGLKLIVDEYYERHVAFRDDSVYEIKEFNHVCGK
ncbi:wall-associated kinase family protein [Tanacetum coccineum]